MEGRKFLYFALNPDGMFATFPNGFLQWTSAPTPLVYTPDGWQDLSITEELDSKYFGLNRTYGTPQNFVEDGAGILKTIFYNSGYNAQVTLLILEQQLYFSDTEYGYYYTQLAKCSIDFTTFSHQGEKVVSNILEGDLKAMFLANEDTAYEISIELPFAKIVLLDGLKLKQYANYIVTDPVDLSFVPNGNNLIGLDITSTEQKTQLGTQNVVRTRVDDNTAIFASKQFLLGNVPIDTDFTCQADFGLTCTLAPGVSPNPAIKYTLALRVYDKTGALVTFAGNPNLLFEVDGPTAVFGGRIQVKGTSTVHLLAGYTVYLWSGVNITNESGADGGDAIFFNYDTITSTGQDTDSNVIISYFYIFMPTQTLWLEPLYILQQLVSMLSGGKYTAQSDFLSSLSAIPTTLYSLPYSLFTSGDAVRALSGAVLKISVDDFFASINGTYNLGLGIINNVLRIEPKAFWVSNPDAEILLGEGSKFQCDVWTDVLFNTVSIGCPNETYDEALGDINGKYEINMTHHYGTPVLNINVDLDLTTKARRDMYGLEYTRINLDGKTTSDADSDNDMFELAVINVPETLAIPSLLLPMPPTELIYRIDRSMNQYVVGLLDNTSAFNLKLSPKHCMLRHGNYLRSVLHGMDTQKITFTTADKNTPMVTTYPSGLVVDERGDLEISTLDPRIFLPYIISDTTPVTDVAIQGDTVKKYAFTYLNGSVTASGFALKTTVQPVDNRQQALQLLAAPDLDLTQFIDIWE